MIFFTADTHFGHSNVIQFENRPFQTVDEMDEALVENWNRRVSPEDDIYILGDFTLKGPETANALLERLQGRKYLIRGNHDGYVDRASFHREYFLWVKDYYELQYRGRWFILCHYPLLSWNGMGRGVFQDAETMAPVSIEELLAFWEEEHRPDECWGNIKPSELQLKMTCAVCPEQYDVFDKNGRYLGYLHLRGGSFTVNCIRPEKEDEELVSEYFSMRWHGSFVDDKERAQYLSIARRDIAEFYRKQERNSQ